MPESTKLCWFVRVVIAVSTLSAIALVVAFALLFRAGALSGPSYRAASSVMSPTIAMGDRFTIGPWKSGKPRRWDIVVFRLQHPAPGGARVAVQRIVGLPGERVHIADGKVHVNDEPLEPPPDMRDVYYTGPRPVSRGIDTERVYGLLEDDAHALVPPGHYFILGDRSEICRDSRAFGCVPRKDLRGRATCIWWPPSRARKL